MEREENYCKMMVLFVLHKFLLLPFFFAAGDDDDG